MTDKPYKTPHERGMMDSYYRRPFNPHYYPKYGMPAVKIELGTPEYEEYRKGWDDNENEGEYKDWG